MVLMNLSVLTVKDCAGVKGSLHKMPIRLSDRL